VEFGAFCDFDRRAQLFLDSFGERFARVAAIDQRVSNRFQGVFAALEGFERAVPVSASAVVAATACGRPCVSTARWRLRPETFCRVTAL